MIFFILLLAAFCVLSIILLLNNMSKCTYKNITQTGSNNSQYVGRLKTYYTEGEIERINEHIRQNDIDFNKSLEEAKTALKGLEK